MLRKKQKQAISKSPAFRWLPFTVETLGRFLETRCGIGLQWRELSALPDRAVPGFLPSEGLAQLLLFSIVARVVRRLGGSQGNFPRVGLLK